MKLAQIFAFTFSSVLACSAFCQQVINAGPFLDKATLDRLMDNQTPKTALVSIIATPKDKLSSSDANSIWIQPYYAHQMIQDNLMANIQQLPRHSMDALIPTIAGYQGTHSGQFLKIAGTPENPLFGKVMFVFANNTYYTDVTQIGGIIIHTDHLIPVDSNLIMDREVDQVGNLSVGEKVCAVNADHKVKAGKSYKIKALWLTSGQADLSTGGLNNFLQDNNFAGEISTSISNLETCK